MTTTIAPEKISLGSLQQLLDFLAELNQVKIFHKISQIREDAIMVEVVVPGERWEVEFFADGDVEVEVFKSDGDIKDKKELERLFRDFSD